MVRKLVHREGQGLLSRAHRRTAELEFSVERELACSTPSFMQSTARETWNVKEECLPACRDGALNKGTKN